MDLITLERTITVSLYLVYQRLLGFQYVREVTTVVVVEGVAVVVEGVVVVVEGVVVVVVGVAATRKRSILVFFFFLLIDLEPGRLPETAVGVALLTTSVVEEVEEEEEEEEEVLVLNVWKWTLLRLMVVCGVAWLRNGFSSRNRFMRLHGERDRPRSGRTASASAIEEASSDADADAEADAGSAVRTNVLRFPKPKINHLFMEYIEFAFLGLTVMTLSFLCFTRLYWNRKQIWSSIPLTNQFNCVFHELVFFYEVNFTGSLVFNEPCHGRMNAIFL